MGGRGQWVGVGGDIYNTVNNKYKMFKKNKLNTDNGAMKDWGVAGAV